MNRQDHFPESQWDHFRMFYQGQVRTMCRCKKKITFGATVIKCEYICRQDRPNDANHLCTFNTIRKFFNNSTNISRTEKMFFNFIVKSNISFSSAVSDTIFQFFHTLIRIGQNSILERLPKNMVVQYPSPQILFPLISRRTLSRNFNKAADQIRHERLMNFKKLQYVCLAIDAGIINKMPILDITIVHAFSYLKPLLYHAFRNFSGTTFDYIEKVKSVIQELDEMSITVTAIVGDNLPAQRQAFNHSINSMQKNNKLTIYAKPIWFSCLCHTISLALDDTFTEIEYLDNLQESTKLITKILRTKPMVASLGVICPPFCETRWTNQYDIFKWLLTNHKTIEESFLNPPPSIIDYLLRMPQFPILFYQSIPDYIQLLTPIRDLITFLEGDRTPACYAYPAIEICKSRLFDMSSNANQTLASCSAKLIEMLESRLNSHYSMKILKVLYYLIPKGRDHARETVFSAMIVQEDSQHTDTESNLTVNDSREIVNSLIEKFDATEEKYFKMEEIFSNLQDSGKEISLDSEEPDIEISDTEIDFDECQDNLDQSIVLTQCISDIAEKYSSSFTSDEKEISNYGDRISSMFISWIIDPLHRSLGSWYGRSPYQFWKAAQEIPEYSEFADFVLRLLPIIASEATVERKLYRQRVITPPDRFSTNEQTQLNRIIIADSIDS